MKRVLVFGGRKWGAASSIDTDFRRAQAARETLLVHRVLRLLVQPEDLVIHGDSPGADTRAKQWADKSNVNSVAYPADWATLGPAAGPVRNQQMIDEASPDIGVGFPGGRGTADMLERLHVAGIPVVIIPNIGY